MAPTARRTLHALPALHPPRSSVRSCATQNSVGLARLEYGDVLQSGRSRDSLLPEVLDDGIEMHADALRLFKIEMPGGRFDDQRAGAMVRTKHLPLLVRAMQLADELAAECSVLEDEA